MRLPKTDLSFVQSHGEITAQVGKWLLEDEYEEFAKFFMRRANENTALEVVTADFVGNELSIGLIPRHADVDQMTLDFLSKHPLIAQRRGADSSRPPANYVRFRVTPDLMIAVGASVKKAGAATEGEQVELVVSEESDPNEMGAYEELLFDAMQGNAARFARQDYVEEAWRIVDPVLDGAVPVHEYEPGTWGPSEASTLMTADGGWFDPTRRG